ncbi:MAG: zf-HC2 domain-containing protein [Chloroflexi bacterium]|nr:zf-HC2 domain-containing protein [Chloroflexota bacterium]
MADGKEHCGPDAATLLAEHGGPLYGYLRALVGDAAFADELLGEVLQRIRRGEARGPSGLTRASLYAIATDVARHGARRRVAWLRSRSTDGVRLSPTAPDQDPFSEALLTLPLHDRVPLILYHQVGLTIPELAAALRLRERAAIAALAHAHARLQAGLAPGTGEPSSHACRQATALLPIYAVDETRSQLAPTEAASLERHLAGCPSCTERLQLIRRVGTALASQSSPELPPAAREAIQGQMARPDTASSETSSRPTGRIALPGQVVALVIGIICIALALLALGVATRPSQTGTVHPTPVPTRWSAPAPVSHAGRPDRADTAATQRLRESEFAPEGFTLTNTTVDPSLAEIAPGPVTLPCTILLHSGRRSPAERRFTAFRMPPRLSRSSVEHTPTSTARQAPGGTLLILESDAGSPDMPPAG